jgi:N-acetylneuraminic acid mutarotase
MCNNWPEIPISVGGATGGLIGNTVMICEGDKCYSLTSEKATLATHMSFSRAGAASIVINDTTLWVTGGNYNFGLLASTEYVTMTKTMPGPDLPMGLDGHAMVVINSTCSMVIGGHLSGEGANYCQLFGFNIKNSEYHIILYCIYSFYEIILVG